MPPAVQHRTPAPSAPPARKSSSATAPDPKPDAANFRQELVRQRKEKAEKVKPREAAEATKAPAKAQRPQKARKARPQSARAEGEASPADSDAAANAGAAGDASSLAPPQESTLTSESDAGMAAPELDEAAGARPAGSDDMDRAAVVAGAAVSVRSDVPVDAAGDVAAEGDTTRSPQAVSALAATAVGAAIVSEEGATDATDEAAGGQQDALADETHVGENGPAEATPDSKPAERGAKPQATGGAFGQALARASRPRGGEGDAGEQSAGGDAAGGGASPTVSWMQNLEAAAGEFAEASSLDDSAAAPHAGRAATVDASMSPAAMDLSPRHAGPAGTHAGAAGVAADATPPEARFAADNHDNIVKGMHAEVLPNGGTMRIRLDPPQLGALQVTVSVRDGVVTASFETSNDEATRLLGHSLNQLKAVLESHGVGVDKLQVQQTPRDDHANARRDDGSRHRDQTPYEQEHAARQEQQRKEMLQKMWRRLSGGPEPLDVTV